MKRDPLTMWRQRRQDLQQDQLRRRAVTPRASLAIPKLTRTLASEPATLAQRVLGGEPSAHAQLLEVLDQELARLANKRPWTDTQGLRTQLLGVLLEGASPKLNEYRGDAELRLWLRVVAVRLALKQP